jgi:hypothetical protein
MDEAGIEPASGGASAAVEAFLARGPRLARAVLHVLHDRFESDVLLGQLPLHRRDVLLPLDSTVEHSVALPLESRAGFRQIARCVRAPLDECVDGDLLYSLNRCRPMRPSDPSDVGYRKSWASLRC